VLLRLQQQKLPHSKAGQISAAPHPAKGIHCTTKGKMNGLRSAFSGKRWGAAATEKNSVIALI